MSLDKFSLKDQVAIVTGSCRGIGQALAVGFAQAGAHVVITCRHEEHLDETSEMVMAQDRRMLAVAGDVRSADDIGNIVEKAMAEFGRIDVLINNAGGGGFASLPEDYREKGWDAVIDINVKGTFLFSQAAGRIMLKQKRGNIINISSIAARTATPNMAAYGASKAAIINITKSLALAWGHRGIRVNCIAPGATATREARALLWNTPEKMAAAVDGISLGRLAEPEEMVGPAIFLASEASSFMNGQTLFVDGGARS